MMRLGSVMRWRFFIIFFQTIFINMNNFRIQLAGNGKYYVMKKVRNASFFNSEVWECIIHFSGTNQPFGYGTFDGAIKGLLSEIETKTIKNSRYTAQ